MKRMILQGIAYGLILFVGIFIPCESVWAEETVTFLKIAVDAQSALIKMQNGKSKVIHVGDEIEAYGTVQTIAEGRMVIKSKQGAVLIVTLLNGKQNIQRIQKIAPQVEGRETILVSPRTPDATGGGAVGRNSGMVEQNR